MIKNPGKDRIVVIDSVQLEPKRKFATGYNHGVVHPTSPALSWVLNRHTMKMKWVNTMYGSMEVGYNLPTA